jgi:DUF1365 family protein
VLAAAFSGRRARARTGPLLRAFCATPLLTFKIVAAIHFEAARLWAKGLRLFPRPAPPAEPASYGESARPAMPETPR